MIINIKKINSMEKRLARLLEIKSNITKKRLNENVSQETLEDKLLDICIKLRKQGLTKKEIMDALDNVKNDITHYI